MSEVEKTHCSGCGTEITVVFPEEFGYMTHNPKFDPTLLTNRRFDND